jgi:transposase InsO family protein
MVWQVEARQPAIHFLIHDRDIKSGAAFNAVFWSTGAHIIRTPFRAPNANAYAEHRIRTVRHECLNKLFILNQAHLRCVLKEYVIYNSARPPQGLGQRVPIPKPALARTGVICRRGVLGGIIHDYYCAA